MRQLSASLANSLFVVGFVLASTLLLAFVLEAHTTPLHASHNNNPGGGLLGKAPLLSGSTKGLLARSSLSTPPVIGVDSSYSDEAVLDNDSDHDGNTDGMLDPLGVVGTSTMKLLLCECLVMLIVPAVEGLTLRLWGSPISLLSSDYRQALERPG